MTDAPIDVTARASRSPADRRLLAAVVAILAFGAFLRTIQYGALGSMWLDELAIALNVTERSLGELVLRSLDHGQVAPPGFLALAKVGTWLLGGGEAGLRLFPWLASLGALVLFWRVAIRVVDGIELPAGLLVFAASPALVWQAASAKQYSGDVFVTLLLLLLALRIDEGRGGVRGAAVAGAVGGAAILASQPAVLVAAGLGVVLAVRRVRARGPLPPVLALGAGWAVGAAVATTAALLVVSPEIRGAMAAAWSNDFPSTTESPMGPFALLPHRLFRLLGYLLVYVKPKSVLESGYLFLFWSLALVGAWGLARRKPALATFLAVPVLAGVVAALVRLLPLYNRVALYVAPVLLIAAMAGMEEIRRRLSGRARQLATVGSLGLFGLPAALVLTVGRPPYRAEEARPVLAELATRWRPGDEIYVYASSDFAMRFYGPDVEWIPGSHNRGDSRAYFREIDALRGRPRVWFFHTHGFPCEPEAVRSYLEAIGHERDRIADPNGLRGQREAAAYLYDLSDPVRLARADAETHPHPRSTSEKSEPQGCGYSREPHGTASGGE